MLKALHPANPKIGRVAVPSGTTTSSTTAEIIKEYTVVAPSFFPGVSWDCLIVQPPSDTVAAVIFVKPSSRERWMFSANSGANFWQPGTAAGNGDLATVMFIGDSSTLFLGDTYTVQASFNALPGGIGTPVVRSLADYAVPRMQDAARPAKWRTVSSSLTVYPVSSTVFDGGTITAGTFPVVTSYDESVAFTFHPAPRITEPSGAATPYTPGALQPVYANAVMEVPLYTSEMLAVNKGCYVAPAREGVYVPTRLGEVDFVQPGCHDTILEGVYATPAPATGLPINGAVQTYGDPRWYKSGRYNTSTSHVMTDIVMRVPGSFSTPTSPDQVSDQQISVIYSSMITTSTLVPLTFRQAGASTGISDQEVTVISLNGLPAQAAYTIKFVSVIERVPTPDSPSFPYIEPAPEFDPAALALYKELKYRMPQGYPASANAWGTILALIAKAAKVIIPALVPFLVEKVVQPAASRLIGWATAAETSAPYKGAPPVVRSRELVAGAQPHVVLPQPRKTKPKSKKLLK